MQESPFVRETHGAEHCLAMDESVAVPADEDVLPSSRRTFAPLEASCCAGKLRPTLVEKGKDAKSLVRFYLALGLGTELRGRGVPSPREAQETLV